MIQRSSVVIGGGTDVMGEMHGWLTKEGLFEEGLSRLWKRKLPVQTYIPEKACHFKRIRIIVFR